jgi:hypothetical protein
MTDGDIRAVPPPPPEQAVPSVQASFGQILQVVPLQPSVQEAWVWPSLDQ